MSTATATTLPVSSTLATYYVVPVVPEDGTSENVRYFEDQGADYPWASVAAAGQMNTRAQGHITGNALQLIQPALSTILLKSGLPADKIDSTATLYAAVARTLVVAETQPSVFSLVDSALTIPVTYMTVRGVILVFTRTAQAADGSIGVTELIASTDPEIKNSTGTDD